MKAESLTKKQLGEFLVNLAIEKIELWAEKELHHLTTKTKKVICLPLNKNSWLVGRYKIISKDGRFYILTDNTLVHSFLDQKAAFLYCILDKMNIYKLSNQILQNDQLVDRLSNECNLLKLQLLRYKNKNKDKIFLTNNRLSDAKQKLSQAKKELEKNLISAKYLKVWD